MNEQAKGLTGVPPLRDDEVLEFKSVAQMVATIKDLRTRLEQAERELEEWRNGRRHIVVDDGRLVVVVGPTAALSRAGEGKK